MIITSASGMCEAGRVLHHLKNNIEDERNTVLIVSFQAEHTLGRRIAERRGKLKGDCADAPGHDCPAGARD